MISIRQLLPPFLSANGIQIPAVVESKQPQVNKDPRKNLAELMPKLLILRAELQFVHTLEPAESLDGLIRFFNALSPWRECRLGEIVSGFESVNPKQHAAVFTLLRQLETHITNSFRDVAVISRVPAGQLAVAEKIFLGNIFGLRSYTLCFWQAIRNDPKGGWSLPDMEEVNAHDVVCAQALRFIRAHDRVICLVIDSIEIEISLLSHNSEN